MCSNAHLHQAVITLVLWRLMANWAVIPDLQYVMQMLKHQPHVLLLKKRSLGTFLYGQRNTSVTNAQTSLVLAERLRKGYIVGGLVYFVSVFPGSFLVLDFCKYGSRTSWNFNGTVVYKPCMQISKKNKVKSPSGKWRQCSLWLQNIKVKANMNGLVFSIAG